MKTQSIRLRGFLLADSLVSVSLAALATAATVHAYIWCVNTTADASADRIASEILYRQYEVARLLTAAELATIESGASGAFNWRREPSPGADDAEGPLSVAVRLSVSWQSREGLRTRSLEAVVWPARYEVQP